MTKCTTIDKEKLQQQLDEVNMLMLQEMVADGCLRKIEKFEEDFAAWKVANGFHTADDCDTIAATIEMRIAGELV